MLSQGYHPYYRVTLALGLWVICDRVGLDFGFGMVSGKVYGRGYGIGMVDAA